VSSLRRVAMRIIGLFGGGSQASSFDEELTSHLEMHVEDNIRAGMSPEQARRAALVRLGGVEATRLAYRDQGTLPWVEDLVQDLGFALRQLTRTPVLALTGILTLAAGMGASVSILALVDAALLEPLPYHDPGRLLDVTESTPQIPRANLSYADYLDWRAQSTTLRSLDVYNGRGQPLRTSEGTVLVPGVRVSSGFFRTLGVTPVLGRDFAPEEEAPGAPPVVILSDSAWRTRYGGRRDVIGETATLGGIAHTIVGVLPRGFHFAPQGRAELWVPLQPTDGCEQRRSCHNLVGVGRLKEGVSIEAARDEIREIAARLEREYPDSNRGQGASVLPLSEAIVGEVRPTLLTLLGGAGLLLLIGCVNVTSLLLVRSEKRRRELAVRTALGASGARLLRQFVAESLVLVGAGAALALLIAKDAPGLLLRLLPDGIREGLPFLEGTSIGLRMLAVTVAVAASATALFALVPAAQVRLARLQDGLVEGARGATGTAWRRFGFRLVALELATATVLLTGAGLLGRSLARLLDVDLGFRPDHLVATYLAAPDFRYPEEEDLRRLGREVESEVTQMPEVRSAGLVSVLPVSFNGNTLWIRFEGRPYAGEHNEVNFRDISAGYLATIGATLVRGRTLTEADTAESPRVALVNQALVRQYFGDLDPIGQRFGDTSLTPESIREIVGVVADVRDGPLDAEIWPAVYFPFDQAPDGFFAVVARTEQEPEAVLRSLVAAVQRVDADLGTVGEAVIRQRIHDTPVAALRHSATWLVGGFAMLAVLLGAVGLYGVTAYSVGQRTREIGLRLAMGAQRRSVVALVLGETARVTAIGLMLGLAGAVATGAAARALLFETPPWDIPILLGVSAVLALVALLASYVPARRAVAVDPMEALRAE
jgi:macrolide transport system ATP-binding/permease protein